MNENKRPRGRPPLNKRPRGRPRKYTNISGGGEWPSNQESVPVSGEGPSNQELVPNFTSTFASLNLEGGQPSNIGNSIFDVGEPSNQGLVPAITLANDPQINSEGVPAITLANDPQINFEGGPSNQRLVPAITLANDPQINPEGGPSNQGLVPAITLASGPQLNPEGGPSNQGLVPAITLANDPQINPEGDTENKPKRKRGRPSKNAIAPSEEGDGGNKRAVRRPYKKRGKANDGEGPSNQELSPAPAPFEEGDWEEKALILPVFNVSSYSDDEDVDKEDNKIELGIGPDQCPPGELRVMDGQVDFLGAAIKCQYTNERLERVTEFCKQHSVDGRAHLVVFNVPSGTAVYGVDSVSTVPPWNVLSPSLIPDGMLLASQLLSTTGWLLCIHTTEQDRQVEDAASVAAFHRWKSFTLLSNYPIYCQPRQPHYIYTLLVSAFHREGVEAKPYYLNAGKLWHADTSLTRDTMEERAVPDEWTRMEDGRPWRGGAERAPSIWQFLVLAFSKYGDTVIDLIAGTGALLKVASTLGRHALGIESDHLILQRLLKPSEFIIRKH